MKKTITTFLTSILLFGLSLAYNPTSQDRQLLNNFYNKIDEIAENNKEKANNLIDKIKNLEILFKINIRKLPNSGLLGLLDTFLKKHLTNYVKCFFFLLEIYLILL